MADSERPSVLVTGGAKRVGAGIARRFGEAGWHVIVHYGQSREEAERLAAEKAAADKAAAKIKKSSRLPKADRR